MAAQQKDKKDAKPKPVLATATKEELSGDKTDDESVVEIHPEERQKDRQKEWGTQFDKWLINAARREKTVELLLSLPYPGVVGCKPEVGVSLPSAVAESN
jgi:hypothetical protein